MSQSGTPPGLLSAPLREIAQQLRADPRSAAQQAREFLKRFPGQRQALMLLIAGRRLMGNSESARTLLRTLAKTEPDLATTQYEYGLLLSEHGDIERAAAAFSRVTELEPLHADAWRALGDHLSDLGRQSEAAKAYTKYLNACAGRDKKI